MALPAERGAAAPETPNDYDHGRRLHVGLGNVRTVSKRGVRGTEENRPREPAEATALNSHPFADGVRARASFSGLSKAPGGSLLRGAALVAASFAVSTLTLVLPSMPSYDAWVWAIWGRDIVALEVDPRTTPGWKPLPVAFATLLAPFGDAAPQLWIVIARAGGVLALVFAYRLAARLAGPVAGVVAALALALTSGWLLYLGHGLSDPLAVALVLWAIACHLDGRHGRAFGLAFGAALIRPEIAPFLAAYAAFAWLRRRERLPLFAAALVALPIAWVGPAWWSAADLFRGKRMHGPFRPSPDESPTLVVLDRFQELILLPVGVAAIVAVVLAARQRDRVVIALAMLFAAWVGLVAAMAERGFTGNPRYLLPAAALVSVLGGIGVARGLASFRPRWRLAVALALAIGAAPFLAPRIQDLREQAEFVDGRVAIQEELVAAIDRAGGADVVLACRPLLAAEESTHCGRPAVNTTLGPRLAWELGVPLQDVTSQPEPPGVVFRAPEGAVSGVPPKLEAGMRVREIATAGEWEVLAVTWP